MKLYEIRKEIEDALIQDDEHFDPATERIAKAVVNPARLELLKVAFEEKLEGCACVIKNLRAESDALCVEIKRLQARKAAVDNNARGLREYVRFQLDAVKLRKLDAGIHKFRIQRNSFPSVQILDQSRIDQEYLKVSIDVDKKAIGENFKETGEVIPGTEITVESHLRVS